MTRESGHVNGFIVVVVDSVIVLLLYPDWIPTTITTTTPKTILKTRKGKYRSIEDF